MQNTMGLYRRGDMGVIDCDTPDCVQFYLGRRAKLVEAFTDATCPFGKLA
jgi:hypothetical protein